MALKHLRTLLWLRWRLSRNQWRRGGQVNMVITLIMLAIGLAMAVVGGVGGVLAGALGLAHALPLVSMLAWDGIVISFLFFWLLGLVTELQRSEIIDASRLMHLPISLREVFFLNYLASHVCLSLAIWLPLTLGLTLGLACGSGVHQLVLLPLILTFFFMITAWTYCLRGWLAALMVNQRRRRAVIMGVTMFVILLAQMPNLVINVWRNDTRRVVAGAAQGGEKNAHIVQAFTVANRYVPLFWLPQGAQALQAGRIWPGLLAAAGMGLIGAMGLARAYQLTRRFYRGDENRKTAVAPAPDQAVRVRGRLLVERTLPLVPAPAAAVAFANLRSMSRAPEVKMALMANVVVFIILVASMILRSKTALPAAGRPFVTVGANYLTMLGLMQIMSNQFGFDRDGFRALVLLPVQRWQILLGKNIAMLAIGLVVFVLLLVLLTLVAHLGPVAQLQAVLGFFAALLVMCALGNWLSITLPYRISAGSLKPTKTKGFNQLVLVLVSMGMPVLLAPLFLPPLLGWLCAKFTALPGAPVTLLSAVLLLACSVLLYSLTLKPLGRLLQRREQRILQIVTREVE